MPLMQNEEYSNASIIAEKGFNLDFIMADSSGKEIGFIDNTKIDVDIGDTNDFELTVSMQSWKEENYQYGNLIYIPNTEYGGIIEDMEVQTVSSSVILRGLTWRGLLTQKIVEPMEDSNKLILNGELNVVISELIGKHFGKFFDVREIETEIVLKNWIVEPYVTLYDAIMKILDTYNHRLRIQYIQGEEPEVGKVYLQAVPIKDYSSELEYSQDVNIDFNIRECRSGINHLICTANIGEIEPKILHLYVQADGSIGESQYYTGLSERSAYYDEGDTEDIKELEENGKKQLKELQNYKKCSMDVGSVDLEIGDIVGGREYVTGTELKSPVVNKIFRKSDGLISIEYKLKGED